MPMKLKVLLVLLAPLFLLESAYGNNLCVDTFADPTKLVSEKKEAPLAKGAGLFQRFVNLDVLGFEGLLLRARARVKALGDILPDFMDPKIDVERSAKWKGVQPPKVIAELLPQWIRGISHELYDSIPGMVKGDGVGVFTSARCEMPFEVPNDHPFLPARKYDYKVNTNIGFNRGVFRDNAIRNKEAAAQKRQPRRYLHRKHVNHVFIRLHGGGSKGPGHHVSINMMNTINKTGADVISIDLPWHGEGARERLSPLEFLEYIIQFRNQFIDPNVKVTIDGHSLGATYAYIFMTMSHIPRVREAIDFFILGDPVPDSKPGGTLAEKFEALNIMAQDPKVFRQAAADDQLFHLLLTENAKVGTSTMFSADSVLGRSNWVKPEHGGKKWAPTLVLTAEGSFLWVGAYERGPGGRLLNKFRKHFEEELENAELVVYDYAEVLNGPRVRKIKFDYLDALLAEGKQAVVYWHGPKPGDPQPVGEPPKKNAGYRMNAQAAVKLDPVKSAIENIIIANMAQRPKSIGGIVQIPDPQLGIVGAGRAFYQAAKPALEHSEEVLKLTEQIEKLAGKIADKSNRLATMDPVKQEKNYNQLNRDVIKHRDEISKLERRLGILSDMVAHAQLDVLPYIRRYISEVEKVFKPEDRDNYIPDPTKSHIDLFMAEMNNVLLTLIEGNKTNVLKHPEQFREVRIFINQLQKIGHLIHEHYAENDLGGLYETFKRSIEFVERKSGIKVGTPEFHKHETENAVDLVGQVAQSWMNNLVFREFLDNQVVVVASATEAYKKLEAEDPKKKNRINQKQELPTDPEKLLRHNHIMAEFQQNSQRKALLKSQRGYLVKLLKPKEEAAKKKTKRLEHISAELAIKDRDLKAAKEELEALFQENLKLDHEMEGVNQKFLAELAESGKIDFMKDSEAMNELPAEVREFYTTYRESFERYLRMKADYKNAMILAALEGRLGEEAIHLAVELYGTLLEFDPQNPNARGLAGEITSLTRQITHIDIEMLMLDHRKDVLSYEYYTDVLPGYFNYQLYHGSAILDSNLPAGEIARALENLQSIFKLIKADAKEVENVSAY